MLESMCEEGDDEGRQSASEIWAVNDLSDRVNSSGNLINNTAYKSRGYCLHNDPTSMTEALAVQGEVRIYF